MGRRDSWRTRVTRCFTVVVVALLVVTAVSWNVDGGDAIASGRNTSPGSDLAASASYPISNYDLTGYTCAPRGSSGTVSGWIKFDGLSSNDTVSIWAELYGITGPAGPVQKFRYTAGSSFTGTYNFVVSFPSIYPSGYHQGDWVTTVTIKMSTSWSHDTGLDIAYPACPPPSTASSGFAYVTKADGTNCRKSPSGSAAVVRYLAAGTQVIKRGSPVNGWTPITCGGTVSYVSTAALGSQLPNLGTAYVTKSDGTYCRRGPSSSSVEREYLEVGTQIVKRGVSTNGWTPVLCDDEVSYVSTAAIGSTPPNLGTREVTKWDGTNCRKTPSSSGVVLRYLPVGTEVTLRGYDQNGWTPVTCGGTTSYISTAALGFTPSDWGTTYVTKTDGTNCHQMPSMSSTVLKYIPMGTEVTIRAQSVNGWTAIQCGGTTSYVASTALGDGEYDFIYGTPGDDGTYCRTGRSASTSPIVLLNEWEDVIVLGPSVNGWNAVICRGRGGFVSTHYLYNQAGASAVSAAGASKATPTAGKTPSPTPTRTPTKTPSPTVTPTKTPTVIATTTATATAAATATSAATGVPTTVPPTQEPTATVTSVSTAPVESTATAVLPATVPPTLEATTTSIPEPTQVIPTSEPTQESPTAAPTATPSPTASPTLEPTATLTPEPTATATSEPTVSPEATGIAPTP